MIVTTGLTKKFEEKVALDQVDLSIEDGAIFGLIGSNGSGKSTLLRLLSGIYLPDGGTVHIDGRSVFDRVEVKSRISYLGDTPFFFAHDTMKETESFFRKLYPEFDPDLYRRLLEIFPLNPRMRIASMSKGMQRQAALVTAIAVSPKYLLLDEAFDGLDPVMRKALKSILIERAETKAMTTVIASHNLSELEFLCDQTGLLHKGKLVLSSKIDSLKESLHKLQVAFTKVPEISAFSDLDVLKIDRSGSILQMLVRGDSQEIMSKIKRLSPAFIECIEPSLEEIFCCELEAIGYEATDFSL